MSALNIAVVNQTDQNISSDRWSDILGQILQDHGFEEANLSVAIVDDATMQELNRHYLNHDYPTDVLSFALDCDTVRGRLDGEVIVSVDTAQRTAQELEASWEDEMLLYAVHGTLHLVGLDDHQPERVREMRMAEQRYMALAGITQHPTVQVQDAAE